MRTLLAASFLVPVGWFPAAPAFAVAQGAGAGAGGESRLSVRSGDGLELRFSADGELALLRSGARDLPLGDSVGGVFVTDVAALFEPRAGENERAPDPSFETDADSNGFPDDWEFADFWGSGGTGTWDSSVAFDGTHSVRIDGTGGETIWTFPLGVTERTRYLVQAHRKGDGALRVLAFWFDANFALLGAELGEFEPATVDFSPMGRIVTAPTGARHLRLGFQVLGGPTTWIDRARFVRPSPAVHARLDGPMVQRNRSLEQRTELFGMDLKATLFLNPAEHGVLCQLLLEDRRGVDRALDVEVVLPLRPESLRFQSDPRTDFAVDEQNVFHEFQRFEFAEWVPYGHHAASLYSCASVTTGRRDAGLAIGVPPDSALPVRLLLDTAPGRGLVLSSSIGLSWVRERAPGTELVEFELTAIDPSWGFRSALEQREALHPELVQRRFGEGGLWIPFTAPSTIPAVEDFHFAVHEGANSVAEDDAVGIASFVYIEPWDYWLDLGDFGVEPTYSEALQRLQQQASGSGSFSQDSVDLARATFVGGHAAGGEFLHRITQAPWISGSGWSMLCSHSPEAGLVDGSGKDWPSPFDVQSSFVQRAYDQADAVGAVLDGTYLDSLTTYFNGMLDQRRENWARIDSPLVWDPHTLAPALWPQVQVAAAARSHAEREHAAGRFLMGNAVSASSRAAAPFLDYLGIEANWGGGPESDATLLLRRVLAGRRPFCILQNTDFTQFGHAPMEAYMRRCLAYGIYASCFSADASSNPYWEDPALYERDRDLFQKYVPLVQELDGAGWRPVQYASTNRSEVYVERFGEGGDALRFTWWNERDASSHCTLTIEKAPLSLGTVQSVTERIEGRALSFTQDSSNVYVKDVLEVGAVRMLELD